MELSRVRGLWTHFIDTDSVDRAAVAGQLAAFRAAVDVAEQAGLRPDLLHAANSGATLHRPETHFDLVRLGIGLYGAEPMPSRPTGLRPAMSLRAPIVLIKRVLAGTGVSYATTTGRPDRQRSGWFLSATPTASPTARGSAQLSADRPTVAVLFGGRSDQHDVSCASAQSILTHLDRSCYAAVPVRIGRCGRWTVGATDPIDATAGSPVTSTLLNEFVPAADGSGSLAASVLVGIDAMRNVDGIFPALHGPFGEDGTLQSSLAATGKPVVGSGTLASALGMDKVRTKKLLAAAGLTVADSVVVRRGDVTDLVWIVERLGMPLFVKPCRGGSSIGVSRVEHEDDLLPAIDAAMRCDPVVLVEEAITGREVDIGVVELPDGSLEVSPALEIRVADGEIFDFEAKYADHRTRFEIPAALDDATTGRLRSHALTAFTMLGCTGLLRVDFFVRGDGELVFNEVNTFPGFTAASQYPQMWQGAGMSYSRLLEILITTARVRADERNSATAVPNDERT